MEHASLERLLGPRHLIFNQGENAKARHRCRALVDYSLVMKRRYPKWNVLPRLYNIIHKSRDWDSV